MDFISFLSNPHQIRPTLLFVVWMYRTHIISIRKPHRKSHDCFYYKLAVNVLQKKNCHYVRFSTTLAVIPAANRDSSPLAKSKARCTSDVERRCPLCRLTLRAVMQRYQRVDSRLSTARHLTAVMYDYRWRRFRTGALKWRPAESSSISTRGVRRRYISSGAVVISSTLHHICTSCRVCVPSMLRPHDKKDYPAVRGSAAED